jgi:transposase
MCIDEKQVGEDVYTVIINHDTGKIAFMADTLISTELFEATKPMREDLGKVKVINRDLASWYRKFSDMAMPNADQVGDKFHVIKLLLDAGQSVRIKLKRKIDTEKRKAHEAFKTVEQKRRKIAKSKGILFKKKKFVFNEKVLGNGETPTMILKRSHYLLYKFQHQWTDKQKERAAFLFHEFPELEKAYLLSCEFRAWYSKANIGKHELILESELFQWYENVERSGIEELMNFSSTVERNQDYICNYFFHNGATNAKAENKNGKIKKFISSNQGTRDRDFFFFRLKKYYA